MKVRPLLRGGRTDPEAMANISLSKMTKSYGGTRVLNDVALSLEGGRVHALMGENGAGKSTFIKLLAGVTPADSMHVEIDGQEVTIASSSDAHEAGFRFIHQELNIVPQITVAENVLLGRDLPHRFGLLVDWPAMRKAAQRAMSMLGAEGIDLNAMAGDQSADDQMLIKIAGALVAEEGREALLYVLDEPTAALTGEESEKLFAVIERLKQRGAAILYVSHRMDEVMRICDDVTVLRDGEHVMTKPITETTKQEVIQAMTGRDVVDAYPPRQSEIGTETIARVEGATRHLKNLDLDIREGEILGVSGLAGSGQIHLTRLFLGLDKLISGQAHFLGQPLPKSTSQAWERRVAHIPRERRSEGLMLEMMIRSNIVLPHLSGFVARSAAESQAATLMGEKTNLKAKSTSQPVGQLSGGNQQKTVFARALMGNPKLLLLEEPTRGVDVGAKWEIYQLVRELSAQGCAILMTTSDLPEILGMCDRVLVLRDNAQAEILSADITPAELVTHFYAEEEAA